MEPQDGVPVDPTNVAQADAWDGDEGAYWAQHADHFERALARYDGAFFASAAITTADHVLDVGCGTGATTRAAARRAPDGLSVGVDLSTAMLEVARRRSADEGLANVRFERADAQIHPFDRGWFDVAIARTSAMFFGDRVAALANVGRALRSGGRLTLLTWQPYAENEWVRAVSTALAAGAAPETPPPGSGPFSLSEPAVIRDVLTASGYGSITIDGVREPMWFGRTADDATRFVGGLMSWRFAAMDDATRRAASAALHRTMADHETPDGVQLGSAAWIVAAVRP